MWGLPICFQRRCRLAFSWWCPGEDGDKPRRGRGRGSSSWGALGEGRGRRTEEIATLTASRNEAIKDVTVTGWSFASVGGKGETEGGIALRDEDSAWGMGT